MGRNDVPERWEKYTTCGSPIPETPFVAFKVPLSEVRWNWVNSKRNKDAQDKISQFKFKIFVLHSGVKFFLKSQFFFMNPL